MSNSRFAVAVVSRLLLPDDANPAGNVHGGTTLKLMEQAGMIAATRHIFTAATANKEYDNNNISAVLVRFENMSFHEPLYVGEIVTLTAQPIFTSEHSILIQVVVTGENVLTNQKRTTNTGKLWYVPINILHQRDSGQNTTSTVVAIKVPPITIPSVDDEETLKACYENAKLSYETRKKMKESITDNNNNSSPTATDSNSSNNNNNNNNNTGTLSNLGIQDDDNKVRIRLKAPSNIHNPNARTPAQSEQTLCQVVMPSDCSNKNHIALGGFLMKLMDNAAGCSAYRHARTNVVTVAISSIDFLCLVKLGDVCNIHSKIIYCSHKTMEIEVYATVTCARTISNNLQDKFVAFGRFTFVSLDENGKAIPVPPLRLETKQDMEHALQGEERYKMAKLARLANKEQKSRRFRDTAKGQSKL